MGLVVNTVKTIERGATIAHGSASVTTTAAQVLALATGRRSATIQNLGTDYIYLGATGITANNGSDTITLTWVQIVSDTLV